MSTYAWLKKHSFLFKTIILWIIFCIPQNVFTIVKFLEDDFQDPLIPENHTCYDVPFTLYQDLQFWLTGVLLVTFGTFGIFGNIFSILVLKRLVSKSGFNRLLLGLGKNF